MDQSEISQIREEQTRQMNVPKKPYQTLIQSISNLFHPLLILTYTALVICVFTPLAIYPLQFKIFFVGEVFFYTCLMPVIAITLMHVFHLVGHWALRDRRDRALPFLVNFICYSMNLFALYHNGFMPSWVLSIYWGSIILTFLAWIISFWWKISAHASADMAGATAFLILYYWFPTSMPLWLGLASILIVGMVCSSRIYLGRHTLAQVAAGSLLGVVCMLLAVSLF